MRWFRFLPALPARRARRWLSARFLGHQGMGLTARKFEDGIVAVIRVQKLSMPGTGGEPAGSPFTFREERRCPNNSLPISSRWRRSEALVSQSKTRRLAVGSLRTSAISRS